MPWHQSYSFPHGHQQCVDPGFIAAADGLVSCGAIQMRQRREAITDLREDLWCHGPRGGVGSIAKLVECSVAGGWSACVI